MNDATFDEREHPRDPAGRFDRKEQTPAEVEISAFIAGESDLDFDEGGDDYDQELAGIRNLGREGRI